ncbi:MAG: hypothetical protein FJ316_07685 [SAR202 cluster bacterium]|nr:hypothetical protein [SAR202 cluster bacterium]
MRQSAVMFKAAGLSFEGVVGTPNDAPRDMPGVVICHPHPLAGGNMDNNVVLGVFFALVEEGCAVLRFNFRGVGNSQGEHTKGECEHQEALAALDFIKSWPGVDGRRLGLVGYSFGTRVILGNSELQKRARAIALVSPSLEALEGSPLKQDRQKPMFVITGGRDKLAQSGQWPGVLDTFACKPESHLDPRADHFWVGLEMSMSEKVGQFMAQQLR